MKRAELLSTLGTHPTYDLVVVGGGATGLGVALDAVLRGFKEIEANLINLTTTTTKAKRYENFLRCLRLIDPTLTREYLDSRNLAGVADKDAILDL